MTWNDPDIKAVFKVEVVSILKIMSTLTFQKVTSIYDSTFEFPGSKKVEKRCNKNSLKLGRIINENVPKMH